MKLAFRRVSDRLVQVLEVHPVKHAWMKPSRPIGLGEVGFKKKDGLWHITKDLAQALFDGMNKDKAVTPGKLTDVVGGCRG